MQAKQPETQQHERKRGAIVQGALSSQAEAQPITITLVFHLHIRGQYRVSGSQYPSQQHRCAQ